MNTTDGDAVQVKAVISASPRPNCETVCSCILCVDSSNNLIMCSLPRVRRDDSEESKEGGKKASGRDVNEASVFGSDGEVYSSRAEVMGSARER